MCDHASQHITSVGNSNCGMAGGEERRCTRDSRGATRHVVVSALGRLAGIAPLGLALTSWPGPSAWFVTPAMLVYNLLATVYLGYLGLVDSWSVCCSGPLS